MLESVPAAKLAVYRRSSQRQMTIQTCTRTYSWFRDASEPNVHVFGLQEEAAVPGQNSHSRREIKQTPHRKTLGGQPGNRTQGILALRLQCHP